MPAVPSDRRNRVFIGGIGDRITKEDIENEFGRFGRLTNVWVAQNPPGFAFVEYDHISEADLAVNEMNGKPFLGSTNKIRVEHSHGGKSRNNRRGPGGGRFDNGPRSGYGSGPRNFNSGGDGGGFRNNGGGYRRMNRDGGGFGGGGGGGGRFDGVDKRRPFQSGGGGRFPSGGGGGGSGGMMGGGGGGPPRYGRNDRPYGGGPRRSRSPNGRSNNKYPPRVEPSPMTQQQGFAQIPTGYGNPSPY